MKKRFVVRPIDNLGSVEGLARDRTWGIFDRETGQQVNELPSRVRAREDASLCDADPKRAYT